MTTMKCFECSIAFIIASPYSDLDNYGNVIESKKGFKILLFKK